MDVTIVGFDKLRCVKILDSRLMCRYMFFFIFFFKQKTAYEMRISDWSSDVCSSDLALRICGAESATRVIVAVATSLSPSPSVMRYWKLTEQIGSASCRERVCQYV